MNFDTFASISICIAISFVTSLFVWHMTICLADGYCEAIQRRHDKTSANSAETMINSHGLKPLPEETSAKTIHSINGLDNEESGVPTETIDIAEGGGDVSAPPLTGIKLPTFNPIQPKETCESEDVQPIKSEPQRLIEVQNLKSGIIHVFETVSEAAKELGLNRGSLSNVLHGRVKQTKGYSAQFV